MKNHKIFNDAISSGVIGMLYAAKNPEYPDEPLYSIHLHPYRNEIKFDLDFWNEMTLNHLKPCSIPNFYGAFREDSGDLHTLFDYLPTNLKSFIKENQNQNKQICLDIVYRFSKNLTNTLAFLQSKKMSHIALLSENILMNQNSSLVYVMDFVKEGEFKNCSVLAKFLNYKNKDNCEINPYKFNVFCIGLIILEMGISDFSKPNFEDFMNGNQLFEKWVDEQIILFEQTYNLITTDSERENKWKLIELIKQCLILNEQKRPDFLELFLNKIKNDSQILHKHLFCDDEFMLTEIDKFNASDKDSSSQKFLLETKKEFSKIKYRKKFIFDFLLIDFHNIGDIKKYNKIIQPFRRIEIERFIKKTQINNDFYLGRNIVMISQPFSII